MRLHGICVLLASTLVSLIVVAGAAAASVTTVMTGLDNPRGLAFGPEGALYVAEAGRGGAGPAHAKIASSTAALTSPLVSAFIARCTLSTSLRSATSAGDFASCIGTA